MSQQPIDQLYPDPDGGQFIEDLSGRAKTMKKGRGVKKPTTAVPQVFTPLRKSLPRAAKVNAARSLKSPPHHEKVKKVVSKSVAKPRLQKNVVPKARAQFFDRSDVIPAPSNN